MKYVFALLLATLLAGCDTKNNEPHPHLKMNSMKTHCMGHSLIDLPENYALKPGALAIFTPDQEEVEDANIDLALSSGTTRAAFERQVTARHAELAAVDHGTTDKLTLVKKLDGGGMLFRVQVIDDAYKTEVHFLVNDAYLTASISSYNNQVLKSEALLLDFIGKIESTAPNGIPGAFCFGAIAVKGRYRSEAATLRFIEPEVPDTVFSVDINTFVKDSKVSLLQRLDGPDSLLKKFNVGESVLRKGERKVAGMRAQEWLGSVRLGENRDQKQLGFSLETMRPNPSPTAPKIHLEMEVKGNRALDEEGAMQLWGAVTGSIRSR